jgi:hypothetical protein
MFLVCRATGLESRRMIGELVDDVTAEHRTELSRVLQRESNVRPTQLTQSLDRVVGTVAGLPQTLSQLHVSTSGAQRWKRMPS